MCVSLGSICLIDFALIFASILEYQRNVHMLQNYITSCFLLRMAFTYILSFAATHNFLWHFNHVSKKHYTTKQQHLYSIGPSQNYIAVINFSRPHHSLKNFKNASLQYNFCILKQSYKIVNILCNFFQHPLREASITSINKYMVP